MKKTLLLVLQILIVLIGIGVFIFLLWEPHLEGRNLHATFSEIYFNDPFLIRAYTASIAFFVGLYQTFKVVGNIRKDNTFSQDTKKSLGMIKYCAIVIICFILVGEAYLFLVQSTKEDDIAGGVAMGVFIMLLSGIIATVAGISQRRVQSGLQKAEA